ncbi:hypothetical protein OIV83_005789 [Microbotryomycetes sp. JL201]|nr:hypothetical protein OIV83_005789 [Microbotryomycetes sp. JL201]
MPIRGRLAIAVSLKSVAQANILQRHGARFPTLGAAIELGVTVEKLVKYRKTRERGRARVQSNRQILLSNQSRDIWAFLDDWNYKLGIDDLVPYGEHDRINTAPQGVWLERFATPIARQLDDQSPQIGLIAQDIVNMAHLCAFETLAFETQSPFCQLYTDDEWRQIEYHGDLGKYYGFSYGNPLSRAQGVGYVNELLSRLTGNLSFVTNDTTQVNQTLDRDPRTFPLDRMLNVDFSHDNQLLPIMTLLGLFNDDAPLSPTKPNPDRQFVVSKIVSFAARLVVERIECTDEINSRTTTYVRTLINDAAQSLQGKCSGQEMCLLKDFIESLEESVARASQEYRRCFDD